MNSEYVPYTYANKGKWRYQKRLGVLVQRMSRKNHTKAQWALANGTWQTGKKLKPTDVRILACVVGNRGGIPWSFRPTITPAEKALFHLKGIKI